MTPTSLRLIGRSRNGMTQPSTAERMSTTRSHFIGMVKVAARRGVRLRAAIRVSWVGLLVPKVAILRSFFSLVLLDK
jgi:hypothetical protein